MPIAGPLIETKLFLPRLRGQVVPRPRLSEHLDRGAEARLTLLSAPPGFGKSTVLAGWLAEWLAAAPAGQRAAAWLSLDEGDRHPITFWTYLATALQRAAPGAGTSALALLQSPQSSMEAVLATLLNDLSAVSHEVVLVLDDYHAVDAPEAREIQEGMAFLLDRLPPQIHLVLATRADPPLPLARLRARGELIELRAAGLRFTPDEAAAYLNQVMGLGLTAQDVAALEGRTEGWIAALQLAALSLQGRHDVAGFIAGFTGDDRYVIDYLAEEVLQRQPQHLRRFLLQTSVLDRLNGSLCDAVTGQDGGRSTLESLERRNLFVVPLDDRRQWYRYHHLFAGVLRAHLAGEHPGEVPDLHRRAGDWFERNGDRPEAIRHALAAGEFATAADLVELAAPALLSARQEATVLRWLEALPEAQLRLRPVLSNAFAGALMQSGAPLDTVETRLRDAEEWLALMAVANPHHGSDGMPAALPAGMIVVDQDGLRRLPGSVAVHRAGLALVRGNVPEAVTHARRALDLVPQNDQLEHGAASALLGLAAWANGNLEEAYRTFAAGMERVRRAGYVADSLGSAIALADIRIAQGRLREATRIYEQALQFAAEHTPPGAPPPRGTADMHVGLSELYLERNDLHAAAQHLLTAHELGEPAGLTHNRYRYPVAMARLRETERDFDGALALLDEAERLYVPGYFPSVRPIVALKARVWLAQGKVQDTLAWARERGLSAADNLTYLREFEHLTLARALLAAPAAGGASRANDAIPEAMSFLERLLCAAEEGGRTGTVIEVLVLQALAHHALGDTPAALARLERALTLAEPEHYARLFVDEGPPMAILLQAAAKRRIVPHYVNHLLAAFGDGEQVQPSNPPGRNLVEPLSERELDVLRLLAGDLDGPDIARQLVVSLNTVRTHTKNIYAKLGVNNRREAVRRAAELNLLSRARR